MRSALLASKSAIKSLGDMRRLKAIAGQLRSSSSASPSSGSLPTSFINRANSEGLESLLGAFETTDRFDRVLESMRIVSIASGKVEAEVTVVEGLQNAFGTLHGGATCTLIDVVGTLALLSLDKARPGVSVELNSSFVAAARGGETVKVVGTVLKTGKRLGFTQVDILGSDGRLCATGRHTKAL